MSCEYRRRKFLGLLASRGAGGMSPALDPASADTSAEVAAWERIYQRAYDAAGAKEAEERSAARNISPQEMENRRKTRLFFGHMLRMGVPLPVHSASGLPKPEAQAGYAALWDALKVRIAASNMPEPAPASPTPTPSSLGMSEKIASYTFDLADTADTAHPESGGWAGPWLGTKAGVRDEEGYSQEGYDSQGFDRGGRDRSGFDSAGCDQNGYNRSGFDRAGFDREQYSKEGFDKEGYNRRGFDKEGRDRSGYDWLGFDRSGFDRAGYNKYGYNKTGLDQQGYDREGYSRRGYNRRGYNRQGLNSQGFDRFGYGADGTLGGFDKQGYDAQGYDADGYDRDAYDADGYDRGGFNNAGRDRSGSLHPWWQPDAEGYYGDGLDRYGYDKEGYDAPAPEGRDRWGFNREGLNERERDRDGYNKDGYDHAYLDREQYNQAGYDTQGYDRLGYDMYGCDRSGYSSTGYDKQGYDKNGIDRAGRDRYNRDARTGRQYKTSAFNKSGFDKDGYDRWGFHRDTGLTSDGRNYAGWAYDPATKSCHEPSSSSPPRSMPHNYGQDGRGVHWQRPGWQTRIKWDPSITPRWDPRSPMSWEQYASANGTSPGAPSSMGMNGGYDALKRSYEARLNRQPNVEQRWQSARARFDPAACVRGVSARCPHCGQFTGYKAHRCPAFGERAVNVYRSGLARREGYPDHMRAGDDYTDKGLHADTRQTMDGCYTTSTAYGPLANGHSDANPMLAFGVEGREPAFSNAGYNRAGYDQQDFDRFGRDRRGRDMEGYDRAGYDWLGRDRSGYDKHALDRNGYNRAGVKQPRSLSDLAEDYSTPGMEGDVLANEGVRRLYSQVASSLAGKPRNVLFREGGFATDMQGTIYLDPYPLGQDAPPVYNAAVVMEGLQHEMGHELETPYDTFKRILDISSGKVQIEGLEAGRALVKGIYNIVEDGRMERRISLLPGVAEYLAVGCRLQPRWDERVGEQPEGTVPLAHEVQGALLYEALPYYSVRAEVLEGMSPEGRALFEELRPIVHQGVFGEPEDAYRASIEIARRLQDAGILSQDEQLKATPPAFFPAQTGTIGGDSGEQGENGRTNSGQGGEGAPGNGAPSPGTGDPGAAGDSAANASSGSGQLGSGMQASSASAGGPATFPGSMGERDMQGTGGEGALEKEPSSTVSERPEADTGRETEQSTGSRKAQGNLPPLSTDQNPADTPEDQAGTEDRTMTKMPGQAPEGRGQGRSIGGAVGSGTGGNEKMPRDAGTPFSDAQAARVLGELERDLAAAVESDIKRQSRVEVLGRSLHKPIGNRESAQQVYKDPQGRIKSAPVFFPRSRQDDGLQARLQKRRAQQQHVGLQLARYLENVQDVTEETANFQSKGKLDRHRFAAALKDAPDIYKRRIEVEGTGFALSMAVDVSGSMQKDMKSGALCDAALVLSDACDEMSMPYEVRAFSGRTYQYKSMDEPQFSLDRAAMLINGEGGGTNMASTAGLAATSLLARPERNKLFVSLTDGELGDHDSTMRQMEQARRDGVLTFGIFLSRGSDGGYSRERMDQIYGKANWTVIGSIQDMPAAVGRRIALLMRRAR